MRTKSFKIDMVSDTEARCSVCGEVKPVSSFRSNKGQWAGKKFMLSFCNTCRNKRRNAYLKQSPISMFKSKIQGIKQRCKSKGIKFDVTAEYLYEMFTSQGGKCFYSGDEMFFGNGQVKRQKSLSVDRVDANKGYVVGNVVLCTDRMNSIKNNLTLEELKVWIPKMYKKLKENKLV